MPKSKNTRVYTDTVRHLKACSPQQRALLELIHDPKLPHVWEKARLEARPYVNPDSNKLACLNCSVLLRSPLGFDIHSVSE